MTQPSLPTYSPEKFQDREGEIAVVHGLAIKISQAGRQLGQPNVITLRGERGAGKTWLCLHLKRKILPEVRSSIPILLSLVATLDPEYIPQGTIKRDDERFVELDKPPMESPDQFCINTLKWVATNLGTTTTPTAGAGELSNWLVRDIKEKLAYKVIVFILDSVFETDWGYLRKLEEYLLVPLATLPNALLVMTGRGSSYPWTSPYLRITEEKYLSMFDDDDIKEQVGEQASESGLSIEQIREISGGNPLVNLLVAQSKDLKVTLDAAADLLLDIKSKKYKPEIRIYFEALCVLDGFDEEEIAPMLSAFYDDLKYKEWSDEKKRKVRDEMIDTHLVRWESGKFVIDESVRRVLEKYLRLDLESGKWERLHKQAEQLYEDWAKQYAKHAEFFKSKAKRHIEALEEAGLAAA